MTDLSNPRNEFKKFCQSRGFQKLGEQASEAFGDSCETYSSKDFKIRLVSDRGEVFLDVANKSKNDWFDLALVYSEWKKRPYQKETISKLLDFLEHEFNWLIEMMSDRKWKDTKSQLEAILASRKDFG